MRRGRRVSVFFVRGEKSFSFSLVRARIRVHSCPGVAMSMLAFAVRRGAHVFRDAARVTGVRPLASFHTSAQVRHPPQPPWP